MKIIMELELMDGKKSSLKEKLEEGKLYLQATGENQVDFKLTEKEIKEFQKIGKPITFAQFNWFIRAWNETNTERLWYRMEERM